jgi:hypothetical protein
MARAVQLGRKTRAVTRILTSYFINSELNNAHIYIAVCSATAAKETNI